MGKIGDLWVRLGLKKDDYTKGLKEAAREGESFGKGVAALGGKAKLAFAAVAAAVTGVIAAVKDLAKQNQVLGDAWNRMSAGMAASWDTFKNAVASMDFSHLISNMREAYNLAKDLYNAVDALDEINAAYAISSSEQLEKINELRVALQDANLSDKERLAKGKELLAIYTKLEQDPTRGLANVKDATLDKYMRRMNIDMEGFTDQELAVRRKKYVEFFKWLGTKEGEVYSEAAKKVAAQPLGLDSDIGQNFMRNAANNGRAEFAKLAYEYNKHMGPKDLDAVRDAVVAYNTQVAKYSTETRRIQTLMNSIEARGAGGSGTGGGPGTEQRVDLLQQEIQLLRQELDEEKEIAALDAAFAAEGDKDYQRWRDINGFFAQPIGLDNEELIMYAHALQDVIDKEKELSDVSDMLAANQDEINARLTANLQNLGKVSEDVARSITESLVSALENGLVGAFDALANAMGGVTDGGMESVARALIEPLADMAIKAGTLIMMSGTAIEALKESLIGFFGGSAVVAGGALIAVGLAAKAGLAAIGNKGGSQVSSFSGGSGTPVSSPSNVQTAELVVHVEGTVKGSDIILAGNNTLNSWGR